MTSKPALTRLAAIGPPMMPRPTKPTVVMRSSSGRRVRVPARAGTDAVGLVGSGGAAALAGQPGEAVGAGAARLVLQPDPAAVAGGGELTEMAVEVEGARAGLVAPGGVGDLDVGDLIAVGGGHLIEVVAVDGQVVEVAEEAEVPHAGFALDPVEHGDNIGGGQQRVAGRAADRLDQHGAADPGRGLARDGQVLDGEVVLGGRVGALDPIAVEGVERPAPQPLPDADGDLDVVAELDRADRPGHQAPIA